MSIERFIGLFQDKFNEDVNGSVTLSDNEIDIFGVVKTNALEILEDDPVGMQEVKIEWINLFIERARIYRDEISDIWQNEHRLSELSRDLRNGNITPFVGSGMSLDSGFPLWKNFLKELRKFSSIGPERFEELLVAKKYEDLATEICDGMDSTMTIEVMRKFFLIKEEDVTIRLGGPVRLLPLLFKELVLTTNYDNVLEAVYGRFGIAFEKLLGTRIEEYHPVSMSGAKILLKLHGDLFRPGTRVLTKAEYESVYAIDSSYRKTLESVYSSNQFLFLGCSLDVDRTLDVFSSSRKPDKQHYAFLPVMTESEDREVIHASIRQREEILRRIGIFPIWYTGNHSLAIQSLLVTLISDKGVV